jgi:hypothetical protein
MNISITPISIGKLLEADLDIISKHISRLVMRPVLFFLYRRRERLERIGAKETAGLMENAYLILIGGIKLVDTYDESSAFSELAKVRKLILKFDELMSSLEKIQYYKSDILKERTMQCLSAFFELELALKKKAFHKRNKPADDFLKLAMAKSSKNIATYLN